MIAAPNMPPMDLGAKASIRSHYDLATPFYRLLWGPHIHHGLWSAEDAVRERPLASPLAAQEALTDALASLANIERGQHVRVKADRCRHFEGFVFGTSHALRAQRGVHLGCEKLGCGQGTRKVLLRPLRVV